MYLVAPPLLWVCHIAWVAHSAAGLVLRRQWGCMWPWPHTLYSQQAFPAPPEARLPTTLPPAPGREKNAPLDTSWGGGVPGWKPPNTWSSWKDVC